MYSSINTVFLTRIAADKRCIIGPVAGVSQGPAYRKRKYTRPLGKRINTAAGNIIVVAAIHL